MSDEQWLEEARKRAASKHDAKQLRFLAPDDDQPDDEEIIVVPVGGKVEGVVVDLAEMDGQFGPTILASVEDKKYGTVKILAGPKILSDLFSDAQVGDFVSMVWNGKRTTKDGSTSYRHWSVAHYPAPGSTPKVPATTAPAPSAPAADDDLDDDL